MAYKLGLSPKAYHNIENGLNELNIYPPNINPLTELVVTWRASLAAYLRSKARNNGIDISPSWYGSGPEVSQY